MSGEDRSEGAGRPGEAGMKTGFIGILAVGLMIGIIIGVAVGAFGFPQAQSSVDANILTADEAGKKAADFINNNLVQLGTEVALGEVKEESGLYNVTTSYMENQIPVYITKDGKILFLQGMGWIKVQEKTIGNFIISSDEICLEDGKPIIYFFGADWCGGCKWEHPVIENVTAQFEGYISFHDNIDSTADEDIFAKYSDGHIPTLVLGCKYYRVGAGISMGEEQETKVLTALICDLTDNKPIDVCTAPEIVDLINTI